MRLVDPVIRGRLDEDMVYLQWIYGQLEEEDLGSLAVWNIFGAHTSKKGAKYGRTVANADDPTSETAADLEAVQLIHDIINFGDSIPA